MLMFPNVCLNISWVNHKKDQGSLSGNLTMIVLTQKQKVTISEYISYFRWNWRTLVRRFKNVEIDSYQLWIWTDETIQKSRAHFQHLFDGSIKYWLGNWYRVLKWTFGQQINLKYFSRLKTACHYFNIFGIQ